VLEARRDSLDRVLAQIDRGERVVLERRAREEFGFARKNERIYLLPEDAEDDRTCDEAEIRGGERFSDRPGQ
jgi:cell division protein FtsB